MFDRVAASLGLLPGGAATQFEPCRDVAFGGVLCALPALAQNGLFRHLEACFTSLGRYYTTLQVMTLLGYLALCRVKTVEQLQYQPPGELGKSLGLDRVPEVRCLRNKLQAFKVWFDRESMPSRSLTFLHEIRAAIDGVERVLVVVGPAALKSDVSFLRSWQHCAGSGEGCRADPA